MGRTLWVHRTKTGPGQDRRDRRESSCESTRHSSAMKCHYEVLGVPRDASSEDLKKAYRTLALRWHPDKNLDNVKEAQEQFLLVQQAYEVLCDPQERAFYDKHRESIIRGCHGGDDYKDDSLDVFPYFSSSCFKGYGDDDKSFYTVYREVFNKIATEDYEFIEDSDFEIPSFGNSTSSYEDVVHPFYAYWLSYSTKKSYAWLDPHDIREAPNRRVVRLIEKENKKVRDKARKERNEEIRNLVGYVRKRDKRVQTYVKLLEEKASANAKKSEEKRKQQLKEKQAALKDYKESEWSKFSNVERELKEIEARMAAEFGDSEDSSEGDVDSDSVKDESKLQNMYCVACDKMFKTEKAFANHENSKKHRENVELLKTEVSMNELKLAGNNMDNGSINLDSGRDEDEEDDDQDSDVEEEMEVAESKARKKKKRKSKIVNAVVNSEDSDSNIDMTFAQSKKQRKKQQQIKQVKLQNNGICNEQGVDASGSDTGDGDMSDIEDADDESVSLSMKKGKKSRDVKESKLLATETGLKVENVEGGSWEDSKSRRKKTKETKKSSSSDMGKPENEGGESAKLEGKGKSIRETRKKTKRDVDPVTPAVKDVNLCCVTCKAEFPSKNKLFDHLKKSGHSVYLPKASGLDDKDEGKRTRKHK